MLKIKIKATGQIIEVKDFSRIIIDEENEEIRELGLNEVELIEEDKEDEKHREWICNIIDCWYFINRGKVTDIKIDKEE